MIQQSQKMSESSKKLQIQYENNSPTKLNDTSSNSSKKIRLGKDSISSKKIQIDLIPQNQILLHEQQQLPIKRQQQKNQLQQQMHWVSISQVEPYKISEVSKSNPMGAQNEKMGCMLNKLVQRLQTIQQYTNRLQKQNNTIRQQIYKIQKKYDQQIFTMKLKYQKQIEELRQQLNMFKLQNKTMINQLGSKCQVQQNKMMRFQQIVQGMQIKKQDSDDSIGELRLQTKVYKRGKKSNGKYNSSINQVLNTLHIQNLNLPPVTLKPVMIDHQAITPRYYLIDVNQVQTSLTYIGQTGTWTHLLGRNRINPNKVVQYVHKIKSSQSNAISIGIMDKKYASIRSCGKKQSNCIFYYGGSARLWESGNKLDKIGNGFGQGDIVIMIVFLCEGAIRWYVNGRLEAQYNSYHLINNKNYMDVEWVPFVNMCSAKDTLVWQVGE